MPTTQQMTQKQPSLVPFPTGWAMPFYYASLHCCWAFHYVDADVLRPYLEGTGLEPTIFSDDNRAVAMTNLQFYTNHNGKFLAIVNEVEFNIVCHPTKHNEMVPDISLKQWVVGNDQTKLIGGFRVFVPADNHFAVLAGQQVFGEQKFDATFLYDVPCHNNHQDWTIGANGQPTEPEIDPVFQTKWDYACGDWKWDGKSDANGEIPHDHKIFRMIIDTQGRRGYPANHSPMTLYAMVQPEVKDRGVLKTDQGIENARLTASRWNMLGTYESWFKGEFDIRTTFGGTNENETTAAWDSPDGMFGGGGLMREHMEKILTGAEPAALLTFQSDPAAIENRAFYV